MMNIPGLPPLSDSIGRRPRRLLAWMLALAGLLWSAAPAAGPGQQALAQLEPATAERTFAAAYQLFTDELYREAIDEFVAFRQDYPDHVNAADALYYQAEAALALGQADEAVRLFERFERLHPAHPLAPRARLALGKHFFEAQDYPRAVAVFDDILESDPPAELAAKALYWMGESKLQMGRPGEAVAHFQRAADDYRETATAPTALYAIGFTHVTQGQYDDAAEAFELLAARHPGSPYARNIGLALAEVYYELDEYARAIEEIDRRMNTLGPEAAERALFLLAESHNQLRQSDEAIRYYRQFIERYPESAYRRRAVYGLAWNFYFQDVHQWAVERFAVVREGRDDELAAKATYYQGVNEKLAQRPMEAIGLFEEYLERWPQGELAEHARFELGITYYEQRMWGDAFATFDEFVVRHPESDLLGEALKYRGNTHVAQGRILQAQEDFNRAVALDAAPAALREELSFQQAWLRYLDEDFEESARAFLSLHEAAPRTERGGEALFWAAESFFQTGSLGRARDLFTQYLRDYSGGKYVDAAHYALGWTYFRQARYEEAIAEFRRFLDAYTTRAEYVPYRTDAQLRLADSYYALKRYPEAIRHYNQVAENAGDYALYQIGQAFNNAGDTYEAISAFRRLLTDWSGSQWAEEAQYTLAYLYFQNQDYDTAVEEYRKLIRTYPNDPLAAKAQYGIGDALFNAGRSEEAVEAYMVVLEEYPQSAFVTEAAAGIQYALAALGDQARARQIIEDFAAANPNSPLVDELRFRQSEVRYETGDLAGAAAGFREFVASSGNRELLPDAYYYLGTIAAQEDRDAEAVSNLTRVVENYPASDRFPEAARELGRIHLEAERHADALEVYRRLERQRSGDDRLVAEARYGQGAALLGMGRAEEAERLLREAVETAPDAPETLPAYLGLARVYERSGRQGESIQIYRRLVQQSRDEIGAEALYRLGALLLARGDARGAIDELSRLPVLFAGYFDWVAQGYLLQAQAFRSLGQTGEASRLYDRVIQQYGGTDYAETAAREKEAL